MGISLLDYITVNKCFESAGTIFNENWERFLSEYLFNECVKHYNDNDYKKFKIDLDTFKQYKCKWPGGQKFPYISVKIEREYDGTNTYASWVPNADEYEALLKINPDMLKNDNEKSKNNFISTVIHELTHGFNMQNKSEKSTDNFFKKRKFVRKILKNTSTNKAIDNLDFLIYLLTDTEENARISGFGKEAYEQLKNNKDKEKYTYSEKGIKELIFDCEKSLQINNLYALVKNLNKEEQQYYSYIHFNGNIDLIKQYNNTGFNDVKDKLSEIIGDTCEIVSIIYYMVLNKENFTFYNIKPKEIESIKSQDDYDKVYNKILEQTSARVKNFYNRAVKTANYMIAKYYESNKEKTESDIRKEKIELKKKLAQEKVYCPYCGATCHILDLYCGQCGQRLKDTEDNN